MSAVETQSTVILGAEDVSRAIKRIAHEIIERNSDLSVVVIVGMQTGGTWIVQRAGPQAGAGKPYPPGCAARLPRLAESRKPAPPGAGPGLCHA